MSASVQFPAARSEVLLAVAALSDREYQERVWIRHELPHENFYDSLDQAVHTLFDDCAVLPRPDDAIDTILVDGPEIGRLGALGDALLLLIAELKDRPDEDYLLDARWPEIVDRARSALSAMVLAGPITQLER